MTSHARIYSAAALYDLAFSYRDFEAQCRFLQGTFRAVRGRSPRSFLELAAGPARHALHMSRSGLKAVALDLSQEMADLARTRADAARLELTYLIADMTSFEVPERADLAACLLCGASYLLTDDAFVSHLLAVRGAVAEDGLYVLELTHPSELVGPRKSQSSWTMADDQGQLRIDWDGDPAAAKNGVWQTRVRLRYEPRDGSAKAVLEDVASQRALTEAQAHELARRSGWRVEKTFGDFDVDVTLNDARAGRMILVLGPSP